MQELTADSRRTAESLVALQGRLELLGSMEKAVELGEQVRGLHIRLRGVAKRFDQQERGLGKLIQRTQEDLRKIRLAPVSS